MVVVVVVVSIIVVLMLHHLQRFRPFELLRTGRKRIDYLMACEAKIVAMTCTHAALKRRDMVDLQFKVSLLPTFHQT